MQDDYLTDGYWEQSVAEPVKFDVHSGDTLTVKLRGIGRTVSSRVALDSWICNRYPGESHP